jgi:hypothetical protein
MYKTLIVSVYVFQSILLFLFLNFAVLHNFPGQNDKFTI